MEFQETRYKRLTSVDEKVETQPRRRWAKKMINVRFKGFRLSRSRKLNWRAFSIVLWPRKIAGIYADIVDRILNADSVNPRIIFTSQWGLPVLSHPTVRAYM